MLYLMCVAQLKFRSRATSLPDNSSACYFKNNRKTIVGHTSPCQYLRKPQYCRFWKSRAAPAVARPQGWYPPRLGSAGELLIAGTGKPLTRAPPPHPPTPRPPPCMASGSFGFAFRRKLTSLGAPLLLSTYYDA